MRTSAVIILSMCAINVPFIITDPSRWWNWTSAIFCGGLFLLKLAEIRKNA
jgi:uncharacterized membrane protein